MKILSSPAKKIILFIVLCSVAIMTIFIISGCQTIYSVIQYGYSINRVIYTDDVNKYLQGATRVTTLLDDKGNEVDLLSEGSQFYYQPLIETGVEGVYDIIIGPHPLISETSDFGIGFWTSSLEASVSLMILAPESAIFDNSHAFSGKSTIADAGGDWVCVDDACQCGYDTLDLDGWYCGCLRGYGYLNYSISSDIELTHDQIIEQLGITCHVCWTYTSSQYQDGTYLYEVSNKCDHNSADGGKFIHDGTFSNMATQWAPCLSGIDLGSSSTPLINFNELVVDGFDFSDMYNLVVEINETNYPDMYIGDWQQNYHPENFSYMFSDLPVEKITIKNVKGLGERAKDLSNMFANCMNLKSIEFGNLFDGCKPTNISRMFYNCPQLENIDLTSLDTSEVTNMSEMFALRSSTLKANERKIKAENFINQLIKNETVEELKHLNNGTVYTIESFANEINMSVETVYFMLAVNLGLDIPITYDEALMGVEGKTLVEMITETDNNDEIISILKYVQLTAQANGITVILDAEMYAGDNRENFVNYIINDLFVPLQSELDQTQTYTLESYSLATNTTKEEILISLSSMLYLGTETVMPVSYDEFCLVMTGMSFEQIVDEILSSEDTSSLPDGISIEDYVMQEIDKVAKQSGVFVVTDDDVLNFYKKSYSKRGTLTLGGDNSKFAISDGTDVDNMFGSGCDFKYISLPVQMGNDVTIDLANDYTNGYNLKTTITSKDVGQTFELYVDQPLMKEEKLGGRPLLKVLIIALSICASVTLIVVLPVVRTNRRKRRSFQRSIYMSTRQ